MLNMLHKVKNYSTNLIYSHKNRIPNRPLCDYIKGTKVFKTSFKSKKTKWLKKSD